MIFVDHKYPNDFTLNLKTKQKILLIFSHTHYIQMYRTRVQSIWSDRPVPLLTWTQINHTHRSIVQTKSVNWMNVLWTFIFHWFKLHQFNQHKFSHWFKNQAKRFDLLWYRLHPISPIQNWTFSVLTRNWFGKTKTNLIIFFYVCLYGWIRNPDAKR